MPITFVGQQAAGRTNAASAISVNYALTGGSDSAPIDGDFVVVTVVVGSAAGNPALAVTTPGTWTALGQQNSSADTSDTSMDVSYKFIVGTETAVTIPGSINNAWGLAYSIRVYRGVDPTNPMDVASTIALGIDTGRPNPPAITPVTQGAWILVSGGGAAGTGANYVAPANYTTGFSTATGTDTTDAMVGTGHRATEWTSGAEDPATFTGGTTGATDSWCARTIALRPAPTVVQVEMSGAVSGSGSASGTLTLITGVADVELVEGTTVRATWLDQLIPADWTSIALPITEAEIASIGNWSNVRFRYAATAAGGVRAKISYASLEIPAASTEVGIEIIGAISSAASLFGSLSTRAPLAGAISGAGVAVGALANRFAITGAVAGLGTLVGVLSQRIALIGAVNSSGVLTGILVLRLPIAGAVSGLGTPTGSMNARIALQGNSAALATVIGVLTSRVGMEGNSSGLATLSNILNARIALAGQSSGLGSSLGTLLRLQPVLGNAFGVGTPSAVLSQIMALLGAVSGLGSATGDLTEEDTGLVLEMIGAAQGLSTVSGIMNIRQALIGSALGSGTPFGTFVLLTPIVGASNGLATPAGSLAQRLAILGVTNGLATVTGSLAQLLTLQGQSNSFGSTAGTLAQRLAMQGQSSGLGALAGLLEVLGAVVQIEMMGATAGLGTPAGALSNLISLLGTAQGLGSANGALLRTLLLQGLVDGIGVTQGELQKILSMQGTTFGLGATDANLNLIAALLGQVFGVGAMTGTLLLDSGLIIFSCPSVVSVEPSQTIVELLQSLNTIEVPC